MASSLNIFCLKLSQNSFHMIKIKSFSCIIQIIIKYTNCVAGQWRFIFQCFRILPALNLRLNAHGGPPVLRDPLLAAALWIYFVNNNNYTNSTSSPLKQFACFFFLRCCCHYLHRGWWSADPTLA